MDKFVFTCGDINGIGPEIALKSLNNITSNYKNSEFIFVIPENVFKSSIKLIKPTFKFYISNNPGELEQIQEPVKILVINSFRQNIGIPTQSSGEAAFLSLKTSFGLIKNKYTDAIVTAPVSKTALKYAGVKYPGQTEMFADWSKAKNFVMTFLSESLRVALYSIHIPLKKVTNSLEINKFREKLDTLINMLEVDLNLKNPSVAVLGLNPHAGENGIIGREEKDLLEKAIRLKKYKEIVEGPFSSDAFFANRKFKDFDITFGIYHDQVLIPFKYINAGMGVNYTAGLNIIRTSPDHGTAFDIAGKGIANESSMIEAFHYAKLILKNRRKNLPIK
jgi:4-hydroxythreonine-4-phosphate dehydrogenase